MARFGYLYLNHGLWGQARIVPETWVGESTAMTPNNYGYLWWLFGGGYAAMGDGGNIIFCPPEKDVVIAATASLSPDSSRLTALIMEEIIPMALASQPRTDDRDT